MRKVKEEYEELNIKVVLFRVQLDSSSDVNTLLVMHSIIFYSRLEIHLRHGCNFLLKYFLVISWQCSLKVNHFPPLLITACRSGDANPHCFS